MLQSKVQMPGYGRKSFLAGFETNFSAFVILFLACGCSFASIGGTVVNTREKTFSLDLKLCLRHSTFYFYHIGSSFALIEGIIAKNRPKTFICRLRIWVYDICCSIFSALEVIFG